MAIEFGQLQAIKTKSLSSGNGVSNQFKAQLAHIENIFNQHEAYKAQLNETGENGSATPAATSAPNFGFVEMSPEELTAKMAECEQEFNNYYALMNEQLTPQSNNSPENEDDKNKVKPKNFSGLMA